MVEGMKNGFCSFSYKETYSDKTTLFQPPLEGPKDDDGKLDWSVFPFEEAEEVAKVFESGVKKYGAPFTYRKGIAEERLFSAAVRHMVEIQKGNALDDDSGLSHWAHVAATALMALAQRRRE